MATIKLKRKPRAGTYQVKFVDVTVNKRTGHITQVFKIVTKKKKEPKNGN